MQKPMKEWASSSGDEARPLTCKLIKTPMNKKSKPIQNAFGHRSVNICSLSHTEDLQQAPCHMLALLAMQRIQCGKSGLREVPCRIFVRQGRKFVDRQVLDAHSLENALVSVRKQPCREKGGGLLWARFGHGMVRVAGHVQTRLNQGNDDGCQRE